MTEDRIGRGRLCVLYANDNAYRPGKGALNSITHALTMNGRIHGELKDPWDSPAEVLRKRAGLLDGTSRYSLSLWRLPDGVPFDLVDLANWPQEYVQVAGSHERLTVELRRSEGGVARHYVVGHVDGSERTSDEVIIPWNGYEARVRASEVFDAGEAAAVLFAYYLAGDVPSSYALRPLEI